MLDGVGAASEPNILQAAPALPGYLGRFAQGSPPVQLGNVSLTNLQVLDAICMWRSTAVNGGTAEALWPVAPDLYAFVSKTNLLFLCRLCCDIDVSFQSWPVQGHLSLGPV